MPTLPTFLSVLSSFSLFLLLSSSAPASSSPLAGSTSITTPTDLVDRPQGQTPSVQGTIELRGQFDLARLVDRNDDDRAYVLAQSLLGMYCGSGSQVTTAVTDGAGSGRALEPGVRWSAAFDWEGNADIVKSFAHVALDQDLGQRLSQIDKVFVHWNWALSGDERARRAVPQVQLWLSDTADCSYALDCSTHQITIRMTPDDARRKPSKKALSWAGAQWRLDTHSTNGWTEHTLTPTVPINELAGDLLGSVKRAGLDIDDSTSFLTALQAGVEVKQGKGSFETNGLSMQVMLRA